jgi:tape measure domain-containing protein
VDTLRDLIVKIDFKGIELKKLAKLDDEMNNIEDSLQKIGAEMNDFTRETREATRQTDKLGHEMRESKREADRLGSALRWAGRAGVGGIGMVGAAVGGLTSGLLGASTALGAVMAGMASFGVYTGIRQNANLETSLISWEAILKDAQKAKDTVLEIQRMAALTPFETDSLDKSARLLTLANLGGKDLIKTMTSLGDAVSISGGDGFVLEGVSMALFQMSAKGKILAEEMQQLAERGMDPWNALAKEMGKSTAELMDMASNGELLAKDTLPLLVKGLGAAFSGGMAKQAKTFDGMVSTMKDNFKIIMGYATKPLFDKMVANMPRLLKFMDVLAAQTKYFGMHGFFSAFFGKSGADSIVNGFNELTNAAKTAWNYLDSHFFSNPEFKDLPDLSSKIEFVFDDLWATFKKWLDDGGRDQITKVAGDITNDLVDGLIAASPRLIDAAATIGLDMGTALVRGIHLKLAEMLPDWMPGTQLSQLMTGGPELFDAGKSVVDAARNEVTENGWNKGPLTNNNGDFKPTLDNFADWVLNGKGLLGGNAYTGMGQKNNTTNNTTIAPVTHVTVQGGGGADEKMLGEKVAQAANTSLVRLFNQLQSGVIVPRTN